MKTSDQTPESGSSATQHQALFTKYLQTKRYSTKSITTTLRFIVTYWKWVATQNMEVEEVSYNDLLVYMKDQQKRGITQRTINHYIGIIRKYYDHLLTAGKVMTNPAADLKVKGVKKRSLYHILEPHELQALYHQYSNDSPQAIRNKVMLGLLINQGLTTSELSSMEVNDIDLRQGTVAVKGSKTSEGRTLPLEAYQIMELSNYVGKVRAAIQAMNPKRTYQRRNHTNRLFISDGGNTTNLSGLMTQLMQKVRTINPSVKNAKQLRASVITKWVKMYNLRKAQYLAGHRYVSSTESYLQNEVEGLKQEIEQYHPMS